MEQKTLPLMIWRLPVVMAERGIRTSTQLYRRLEPYGIDISSHQLSRIVARMPDRLNTRVLAALLAELQCDASDLFRLTPVDEGSGRPVVSPLPAPGNVAPVSATHQKPRAARKVPKVPENVLGPSVTSLSSRKKPNKDT